MLTTMQQKLDDLCDQMDCLNDKSRDCGVKLFATYDEYSEDERLESEGGRISICEHAYELNPRGKNIPVETDSSDRERVKMAFSVAGVHSPTTLHSAS